MKIKRYLKNYLPNSLTYNVLIVITYGVNDSSAHSTCIRNDSHKNKIKSLIMLKLILILFASLAMQNKTILVSV